MPRLSSANGAFGMYNYYEQRWLIDRYAGTLNTVFGRPPCVDDQGGTGFHLAFLEDALPIYYREAVREHELAPISEPEIEIEKAEPISGRKAQLASRRV